MCSARPLACALAYSALNYFLPYNVIGQYVDRKQTGRDRGGWVQEKYMSQELKLGLLKHNFSVLPTGLLALTHQPEVDKY